MLRGKELDTKFSAPFFNVETELKWTGLQTDVRKEYKPLLSTNGLLYKISNDYYKNRRHIQSQIRETLIAKEQSEYRELEVAEGEITDDVKFTHIVNVVCSIFNVQLSDLQVQTRKRKIIIPRSMIIFFTRWFTKFSLRDIASRVSSSEVTKDHSTIISSCKAVYVSYETQVQDMYPNLLQAITQFNTIKGMEINIDYLPQHMSNIIKGKK